MHITLRKIRQDHGITQKEMADMLGVSRSCVANWEAGTRHADITIIKKYNELFGHKADIISAFTRYKCNNLRSLDISMLNDDGVKEIYKYYREIIKNPQYLKNT